MLGFRTKTKQTGKTTQHIHRTSVASCYSWGVTLVAILALKDNVYLRPNTCQRHKYSRIIRPMAFPMSIQRIARYGKSGHLPQYHKACLLSSFLGYGAWAVIKIFVFSRNLPRRTIVEPFRSVNQLRCILYGMQLVTLSATLSAA